LKATFFGKWEKSSSQRMSIEHSFSSSGISVCYIMYRRSNILQDYEHVTSLNLFAGCRTIRKLKSGVNELFLFMVAGAQ